MRIKNASVKVCKSIFGCEMLHEDEMEYSKTCLKRSLKIDKTKNLMANGSLMKGESVAECSTWSILQYF